MKNSEKQLSQMLGNYDNLEQVAGGGMSTSSGINASIAQVRGNPMFKAQFDLNAKIVYTKGGVVIVAADLDATLKQSLPIFVFGNSDFAGGFAKGYQLLPSPSAWGENQIGVYGRGFTVGAAVGAALNVKKGDLIFLFEKTIGADVYAAYISLTCEQVAYATLLDSISSDLFKLNNIRYSVPNGSESQFGNNLSIIKQSLFGKVANDFVSPQAFQNSMDFQKNIIDVPLNIGVDKNLVIGTYIDYNVPSFRWTCFVAATQKLTAPAVI